jgi:hypothetical protein
MGAPTSTTLSCIIDGFGSSRGGFGQEGSQAASTTSKVVDETTTSNLLT